MARLALLALLLVLAAPAAAAAQVPASTLVASDTVREIRLADGSVVFGRIQAVEGDTVVIVTTGGTRLEVARTQIVSVRAERGRIQNGRVWRDDPTATRLFFAPTGRSLQAGEAYFGVYELFFPFITYGVSDRVVLTAGTPVIPEAIGEFAYVGGKVTVVQSERVNVGVGAFAGLDGGNTAGIAFAVGTWGTRDNAFSAGVGTGFGGDELTRPVVMLGGESRLGRNTKLLTENYLVPGENGALLSAGVRIFGEQLSADAGVAGFLSSDDSFCCFPVVNFVYTWGRK
jgi:hypothetical protein